LPDAAVDFIQTGLEAAASLLSGKDRMSRALQELRGYKVRVLPLPDDLHFTYVRRHQPTVTNDGVHGWVRIQREEDPKQIQKRFATVTSSVFATFNTEKVFAASEKWEVDLRGCNVELVQRPKNAIKISRKLVHVPVIALMLMNEHQAHPESKSNHRRRASELTTGLDHIYVIADSADYAVAWHAALSAGTRQTTAVRCTSSPPPPPPPPQWKKEELFFPLALLSSPWLFTPLLPLKRDKTTGKR